MVLASLGLCFPAEYILHEIWQPPDIGHIGMARIENFFAFLLWGPKRVQNWAQIGPKICQNMGQIMDHNMGSILDQIWFQFGSKYGSNFGPKFGSKYRPK